MASQNYSSAPARNLSANANGGGTMSSKAPLTSSHKSTVVGSEVGRQQGDGKPGKPDVSVDGFNGVKPDSSTLAAGAGKAASSMSKSPTGFSGGVKAGKV